MKNKKTPPGQPESTPDKVEETPFEAVAGICSVLVVGLFILTFIAQNYVIPSGSMEKTLLIGDHLLVDRITTAPSTNWMPLVHYREPKRGDVTVFYKPAPEEQPDAQGNPQYDILVKRLIGMPGDHIRLHNGVVILNGVAQPLPEYGSNEPEDILDRDFLDEFPSMPPVPEPGNFITQTWAADFSNHVVNGEIIVPSGMYFMMGDNRHNSADSRFWGFVPRQNIVGRPLFNYWSFEATDADYKQTGFGHQLSWMLHVATHFISDTRWSRTFHRTL
jgi:signal peptidase I